MKILVQGYLGLYASMGEWVYQGFKALGYDVDGCDRNEVPKNLDKYDIYFIVDSSEDYSANIPEVCKLIKVFWSMDAHMPGGLQRASNIARKCDLVISTNDEHGVQLLKTQGIKSELVPITYNDLYLPKTLKPLKDRKYDVVMIGNPNSRDRVELWNLLSKFNCVTGNVDHFRYKDAMAEAKIVVNQPTEPWDIILNNRFFEAMGFRSLLLQKILKTDLIKKLGFHNSREFIYWDNMYNLPIVIETILENIEQYQGIVDSGNTRVQQYSMSRQLTKIMDLILTKFHDRLKHE